MAVHRQRRDEGPELKIVTYHDILDLAQKPAYRNKPLSIAVKLGHNYKYVVSVLREHNLLTNADDYNTADCGLGANF